MKNVDVEINFNYYGQVTDSGKIIIKNLDKAILEKIKECEPENVFLDRIQIGPYYWGVEPEYEYYYVYILKTHGVKILLQSERF
jgi:hypothetical protein